MFLNKGSKLAGYARLVIYHKAWQEAARRARQRFILPVSMGVRAIVLDPQGRVLLVRHTYMKGWYLPGGGVESGESVLEAVTRELAEEAHVALRAPPLFHGIFLQQSFSRSNHVACFVVRDFHQTSPRPPDWEIAETGFFSTDALPDDTTRATRARLAEYLQNQPLDRCW
jgi:ADP-ribose pyrophosphatase YjhB (NUDIX family)